MPTDHPLAGTRRHLLANACFAHVRPKSGSVKNTITKSTSHSGCRNTLRVVTARVFYVLRGSLTSPFICYNSIETAATFNVVNHPRCSEPRNNFFSVIPCICQICTLIVSSGGLAVKHPTPVPTVTGSNTVRGRNLSKD